MIEPIIVPAEAVGAGALYSQSDVPASYHKQVDRFGEPYSLVTSTLGGKCLVPRGLATWGRGTADYTREGKRCLFQSTFVPWNDEQARIVDESVALLLDGQSFQIRAPTGFGKTWCMVDVIAKVGRKTLVIVSKEDLTTQWLEALRVLLGLSPARIGIIQGDEVRVAKCPVVIGMVQSLCKEDRYPPQVFQDFGLVVWDESHLMSAEKFSQSAVQIPAKLRVGMSATAGKRSDGRDIVFESHVGPIKVSTEMDYMKPVILRMESPWKMPLRMVKGKLMAIPHEPKKDAHVIRLIAHSKPRNQMIARFVKQCRGLSRQIIVFSALRDHLDLIKSELLEAGIGRKDIAYYVGGMTLKAREKAKKAPVLLATYKMAEYGTDIPSLDTAVLGTPRAGVEQIVGRILRKHEGKGRPTVLDIVDSTSYLYLRYWQARHKWYTQKGAEIRLR